MSRPVVTVNGRFLTQPVTGVQRYAREIVGRLAAAAPEWRFRLLLPPDRIVDLEAGTELSSELDERWWGGRGHLWEQTHLPRLVRRAGSELLLSPGGWGPLALRRQLVVIFDLHPLTHPEYFVPGFVRWSRLAMPRLARVPPRVAVISEHVRAQVVDRLGVDAGRIDIVPPAVGPPFVDWPLGDLATVRGDHCLFVGGDKAQKNLDFVLAFWPDVHRRLGLELVVTERAVGSRVERRGDDPPGVRRVTDPSDAELADLYARALCLLWPSLAEGYGIPLLEAMACGTPFLSADVGAARELAIDSRQVLPLDGDRWVAELERWHASGVADLRARSAETARQATWERSTDAMVRAIGRSLPGR